MQINDMHISETHKRISDVWLYDKCSDGITTMQNMSRWIKYTLHN